ncbi:MAG: helix-turn-helix domain-containing protein [Clostridia bacterium]|nr:helix-turn-helix domain-containing protein [Clostridia bacterium]
MDIGNRIKERREQLGITAETLGKRIGKAKTTIYRYESGFIESVPATVLDQIAKALMTSPAYLMGWEDREPAGKEYTFTNILPITKQRFPLLGRVACGEPIFASEDRESYVEAGTTVKADFCLQCQGDSMIGARILDGDIVFIQRQDMVENGQIAAVIIGEAATLKRVFYYPEKGKLVLQAENPKYEPLVYVGDELNEIRIIGKAVAFQSDVR